MEYWIREQGKSLQEALTICDNTWKGRRAEQVFPIDPNEIVGPAGFGAAGFILPTGVLPYTIRLENKSTALAPAQEVFITQQLDAELNWASLRLGDFGFSGMTIDVPDGLTSYSARLELPASAAIGGDPIFLNVFVSDNGGPFVPFQTNSAATALSFTGQFGHTYGFYSIATDGVSHFQPTPDGAQATTTLMSSGPLVTDARINATPARTALANIVLTFDEALTPTTAIPGSFMLHTAGKDKRPGTADDVMLPVATAVYDDALRTVTLTAQSRKPLKLNQIIRVTAKGTGGVTNLGGAALDGDANGEPGEDFVRSLGLGTKLSFTDPSLDVVSLSLKKGGLIELSLPTTGDPTVRLSGTVAGTSALTGTVKKPKTGPSDGRATIASITGAAGVNTTGLVRCSPAVTTNCLVIGSISAMVVDALLELGDL